MARADPFGHHDCDFWGFQNRSPEQSILGKLQTVHDEEVNEVGGCGIVHPSYSRYTRATWSTKYVFHGRRHEAIL
jgi:hypothetical protein